MAHHHTAGKTVDAAPKPLRSQKREPTQGAHPSHHRFHVSYIEHTRYCAYTQRHDVRRHGGATLLCVRVHDSNKIIPLNSRGTFCTNHQTTEHTQGAPCVWHNKNNLIWQGDMYSICIPHKQKRGANNRASTPTAFDPSIRRVGFPGLQDARTSLVSQHAIHQHGHCSRGYPSTEIRA